MHQVLLAAHKIFSCGMWTLSWDVVSWPEIEPGWASCIESTEANHWITRKVPYSRFTFRLFGLSQAETKNLKLNYVRVETDTGGEELAAMASWFPGIFPFNRRLLDSATFDVAEVACCWCQPLWKQLPDSATSWSQQSLPLPISMYYLGRSPGSPDQRFFL